MLNQQTPKSYKWGKIYTAAAEIKGELYIDLLGPIIKRKGGLIYILVILDTYSKHITYLV